MYKLYRKSNFNITKCVQKKKKKNIMIIECELKENAFHIFELYITFSGTF